MLRDRTLPDGCQEIVFNLNTRVKRSDNGRDYTCNPAVELIGQMTRPYDLIAEGEQFYFGIKFYPHSFAVFTDESIDELKDQSIDVHLLFGTGFHEVTERIFEKRKFSNFVATMENCLNRLLLLQRSRSSAYQLVDRAVRQIFGMRSARTEGRLQALYQELETSPRYLQKLFKLYVGLTPKQLFRLIRFQSCFQYLQTQQASFAELAVQCGYYDQSHFNHEFKIFSGSTPSTWMKISAPLNQFFLETSSRAYLCNYLCN